jgi:hypothetical protein
MPEYEFDETLKSHREVN